MQIWQVFQNLSDLKAHKVELVNEISNFCIIRNRDFSEKTRFLSQLKLTKIY